VVKVELTDEEVHLLYEILDDFIFRSGEELANCVIRMATLQLGEELEALKMYIKRLSRKRTVALIIQKKIPKPPIETLKFSAFLGEVEPRRA